MRRDGASEELAPFLFAADKSKVAILTSRCIAAYVTAAESKSPDTQVIGSLLQKGQQDKYVRVISFNLTNEQYDTLASYFEEAGLIAPGQKVKADFLVKKAIDEFIAMLS